MAGPLVLDTFLPYRLSIASNLVSGAIARVYQSLFGLSIPEWRIVTVVAESRAITQQEIGQRTRMDKVTVSRAAIALERRGLIERRAHPGDGRSQLLHLSETGRTLYENVAPKAKELEARLFGDFTAGELATLTAMLRRAEAAALRLEGEGHQSVTSPRP